MRALAPISGQNIFQKEDGSISFIGEFCVDADGSPRAYHPTNDALGLDYLANAGHPGNWWGVVTDSNGNPHIQGDEDPHPGFCVSTTSLVLPGFSKQDTRRYVDSEKVPFIVVPSTLARLVSGVVLGCKAQITDLHSKKTISAVVADLGPANHLGEASIAAALELGVNPNPKHGGSSERAYEYTFWPGQAANGFQLQPLS